jgi:hypothetical protein
MDFRRSIRLLPKPFMGSLSRSGAICLALTQSFLQRGRPFGPTAAAWPMNADDFRVDVLHGDEDIDSAFPDGDRLRHAQACSIPA